jgi:hypothetical protein
LREGIHQNDADDDQEDWEIDPDSNKWSDTVNTHLDLAIESNEITNVILVDHLNCEHYIDFYEDLYATDNMNDLFFTPHIINMNRTRDLMKAHYDNIHRPYKCKIQVVEPIQDDDDDDDVVKISPQILPVETTDEESEGPEPMPFKLEVTWSTSASGPTTANKLKLYVSDIYVDVRNNGTWTSITNDSNLSSESVYSPTGLVPEIFEDLSDNILLISDAFASAKIGQDIIKVLEEAMTPAVATQKTKVSDETDDVPAAEYEELFWGLDASSSTVSLSNFKFSILPETIKSTGTFDVFCNANRIPLHFYYFILDTEGNLISVDSTEEFFVDDLVAAANFYSGKPTLNPNV